MRAWPAWILATLIAATATACGLDQNGLAGAGADGDASTLDVAVVGDAPNRGGDGSLDGAGGDGARDGALADGAPLDGAPGADASIDASVEAPSGVDAGMEGGFPDASVDSGPDPGIRCGGSFCSAVGQFCCKVAGLYTCLLDGIVCLGTTIRCDDAADCQSGQVCCAHEDPNSQLQGVDCTGGGNCRQNDVVLCDPNVSNACPGGAMCRSTTTGLQGYSECR